MYPATAILLTSFARRDEFFRAGVERTLHDYASYRQAAFSFTIEMLYIFKAFLFRLLKFRSLTCRPLKL
jgi:hypothetical protein